MQVLVAAAAAGFALGAGGFGVAAAEGQRPALSDVQLDRIAGGGDPTAVADGTGRADGKSVRSAVMVASYVGSDMAGHGGGGASGQVSASASGGLGGMAVATSNLSLSVNLP
jgi:hypothetical protein